MAHARAAASVHNKQIFISSQQLKNISYHRAHPLSSMMSESPHSRNPVLSRPAFTGFTGRVSSPLSRPHFPWTMYLRRPSSASPASTGASANWDAASTISNTSQTYTRNPSVVAQYNEETNMRQWTFTVRLSIMPCLPSRGVN